MIDLCESSDSEERSSEVVRGQKESVQIAGGTASPFSSLPTLQMLMAYIIFCCNVHVTIVEGDLKELPKSLVCILLSIAQIAVNRLQFSPLLFI